MSIVRSAILIALASCVFAAPPCALAALCSAADNDIPKTFTTPTANQDYIKREAMIPMRDGVKLYTVIVVPKGASNAPILLTRTPYNATNRALRSNSEHMLAILPQGDEVFVQGGYIRVFQDVRGKYKSRGRLRHDPAGTRSAERYRHRPRYRCLRHHRLAGEEHARIEWTRRHDRLILRGLHGGDGAAQSTSGVEGGCSREPHGGRMDG